MNNSLFDALPGILLRTSLAIAITAIVIWLLLKLLRLKSPAIHRVAWVVVLVQGCIVARVAWDIPWYEPPPQTAATTESNSLPVLPLSAGNENEAGDSAMALSKSMTREESIVGHAPGISELRNEIASNKVSVLTDELKSSVAVPWWNHLATKIMSVSTLLTVWIIGVGILVSVHLVSYVSLIYTLRYATEPELAWSAQWNRILRRVKIRQPIPMRVHDSLGPLICLTPTGYQIVVPQELWEELSGRQREAVLNHELAHYLRGDVWKSFVVRLLALPHWFNPLAWLAVQKFDESGEWACDRYLIENDPQGGTEFANALLQIVQFPKLSTIGVSSASGSSLRERVKRLCDNKRMEDSLMKRTTSLMILLTVFAIGLAEVRLVARAMAQEETPATMTQQDEDATDLSASERMQQFAQRIAEGDDELLKQFREAIKTPAGQTVLRERASSKEFQARQAAQQNALPAFFEKRFEISDDQLVLKPDETDFRDRVLTRTAEYQSDVAEIEQAIHQISEKVIGDDESEKLLKRMLDNPLTPWALYATEIRNRIRPDERTILEMYQSVFVVDSSGKFVVRPGVRARVEEQLKLGSIRRDALKRIENELKIMSDEIADFDDEHKTLKQMFADKYFAAFCCYQTIGQNVDRVDERLQNLFRYFDRVLEDHSDGLRISAEGKDEVGQMLGNFQKRREAAVRLEEPIRQFASRIDAQRDEFHQRVQDAFDGSTMVPAMLTQDAQMRYTTGSDYVQQSIGNRLAEADDGQLTIPDEQREEVVDYAQRMLQYVRTIRRQLGSLETQVAKIRDLELREALQSVAGKYLMRRSINQQIAAQQFDGLGIWIDENFRESETGFVIKDEAGPELEAFLEQVKEIRVELEKDDF